MSAQQTAPTFSVFVDGERHSVRKNDTAVFVGAQCDDCGTSEFDIECWSDGWSIICQNCGSRYKAR